MPYLRYGIFYFSNESFENWVYKERVWKLCISMRVNLSGIDTYCISPGPIRFVWISKQYDIHDGQNREFADVD